MLQQKTFKIILLLHLLLITTTPCDGLSSLSSVVSTNLPRTGALSLTLIGDNLGASDGSPGSRIGTSAAESTVWVSISSIISKGASQSVFGGTLTVTAAAADVSTLATAVSADSPVLASVPSTTYSNSAVTGSVSITVLGSDLGVNYASIKFSFGRTSCLGALWLSDSSVYLKLGSFSTATDSSSTPIVVTSPGSQRPSTLQYLFSVDTPKLTPAFNGPATGSISVTVLGSSAARSSLSLRMRIGRTAAQASSWISVSSLLGKQPALAIFDSASANAVVVVSAVKGKATDKSGFSYAIGTPKPLNFISSNIPVTASTSLTVTGQYLEGQYGLSRSVRLGRSGAQATSWKSDSSVQAKAAAAGLATSSDNNLGVVAVTTYSKSVGTLASPSLSFDFPQTSSIIRCNSPTTASFSLTLLGSSLIMPTIRFAGTAAAGSSYLWVSSSALLAKVAPSVTSPVSNNQVVASVWFTMKCTLQSSFSFDSFTQIRAANSNLPATGSVSVTVLGTNLGNCASKSQKARIGRTGAEASQWFSGTSLICKSGGIGGGKEWVSEALVASVSKSGINTATRVMSYASMNPTSIMPNNVPVTGSTSITLFGANAGRGGSRSEKTRVGGTASPVTDWVSDSHIRLKDGSAASNGKASSSSVVLTSANPVSGVSNPFPSTLVAAISYNTLVSVTSTIGTNTPATGGCSITILSTNALGRRSVGVRAGITANPASLWISTSALMAKLHASALTSAADTVVVTAGATTFSVGTSASKISYDSFVTALTATNVPFTGSTSITMFGQPGLSCRSPGMRLLGRTSVQATSWVSGTALLGKRSDSALVSSSSALYAQVTAAAAGGIIRTLTRSMTIDMVVAPSSVARCNYPTTGSISMTLLGQSTYALTDITARVRMGKGTGADGSTWVSSSSIGCKGSKAASYLDTKSSNSVVVSLFQNKVTTQSAISADSTLYFTSTVRVNGATTGAVSVTLLGSKFGSVLTVSPKSRIGRTTSQSSVWTSDTSASSLKSSITLGSASATSVILSAPGLQVLTLTNAHTVDDYTTSSIMRTNTASTGSQSITLFATGLRSHVDITAKVRLCDTASVSSKWVSDSAIRAKACKMPGSKQGNHVGVTMQAEIKSSTVQVFSMDVPNVKSNLGYANTPRTGSVFITLTTTPALPLECPVATLGVTSAQKTVWISDTYIRALNTIGAERFYSVAFTVTPLWQGITLTNAASYDLSVTVSSGVRLNGPTTGSISLTMLAAGLSNANVSPMSRISGTPVANIAWKSTTSLAIKTPMALQTSLNVVVTDLSRVGSMLTAFTADKHFMFAIQRPNSPTTGAVSLTLLGVGSGSSRDKTARVRIGDSGAQSSEWMSDSSTRSKSPSGTFGTQYILLTLLQRSAQPVVDIRVETTSTSSSGGLVAGQSTSVASSLFSAVFTHDSAALTLPIATNAPRTAAISVTLLGSNIGVASRHAGGVGMSPRIRIGASASMGSNWIADTSIFGKSAGAPAGGLSAEAKVVVVSARYLSNYGTFTAFYTFDLAVATSTSQVNFPATGATSITLLGKGTGIPFDTPKTRSCTFTASMSTLWISQSALFVKSAGGGRLQQSIRSTHALRVSGTLTNQLSFNRQINSVAAVNVASTGSLSLTLTGSQLTGGWGSSPVARIGRTGTTASWWISQSAIITKSGLLRGRSLSLVSSAAFFQLSTLTNAMTADTTQVSSIVHVNVPTTSGVFITLLAVDLSSVVMTTSEVRIAATPAESTVWSSASCLSSKVAISVRGVQAVTVTGGESTSLLDRSSVTNAMTTDSVYLRSVALPTFCNGPVTGSTSMTVLSVNLGQKSASVVVRVGGSSQAASLWTSESSVSGKWTAIGGSFSVKSNDKNGVVVTIPSRSVLSALSGTLTSAFTLDSGLITGTKATVVNVCTTGGITLTVLGIDLGLSGGSPRIRLQGSAAGASSWTSASSLSCKVGSAVSSRGLSLLATAGSRISTITNAISTNTPVIIRLPSANTNIPATSAVSVSLFGSQLNGFFVSSLCSRLQGSASSVSMWTSESSITARAPKSNAAMRMRVAATSATSGINTLTSALSSDILSIQQPTSTSNIPSTGSVQITLFASFSEGFAPSAPCARGSPGTALEAARWLSTSSARCKHHVGQYASASALSLVITASKGISSVSQIATFDIPSPTLGYRQTSNVAASGSTSVTLLAAPGFGRSSGMVTHRMRVAQGTASIATSWLSDTCIRSLSPASVSGLPMAQAAIIVSTTASVIGPQTLTRAFTVALPSLSSLVRANIPHSASFSVTLLGSRMALALSGCSRVGKTGGEASVWVSESSLIAKSPLNTVQFPVVSVSTSSTRSGGSLSSSLSHDLPGGPGLYGRNSAATGATSMTLSGLMAGVRSTTPSVRIKGSAVEALRWISSSSILCKATSGSFDKGAVLVTTRGGIGSATQTVTSDAPYPFLNIPRSNSPATAATSLTLSSTGFSPSYPGSRTVALGGTSTESTLAISSSSIRCKASYATVNRGGIRGVVVTAFNPSLRGSLTRALTVDAALQGLYQGSRWNMLSTGSMSVSIVGVGMSPLCDGSHRLRLVGSGSAVTTWLAETSLYCRSYSLGSSSPYRSGMVLTVDTRLASMTRLLSWDIVTISTAVRTNTASTGSHSITIIGSLNCEGLSSVGTRVYRTSSEACMWTSDSSVSSKRARVVAACGTVTVTTSKNFDVLSSSPPLSLSMATLTAAMSVDAPAPMVSFGRTNGATSGAVMITIAGSGYTAAYSSTVRTGFSGVSSTVWYSSSAIRGKTILGSALFRKISASTQQWIGTQTRAISFDGSPIPSTSNSTNTTTTTTTTTVVVVASQYPAKLSAYHNSATTGGVSITLASTGLGQSEQSLILRVGKTSTPSSKWVSETSVMGMAVRAGDTQLNRPAVVAVTASRQLCSGQKIVSYDAPVKYGAEVKVLAALPCDDNGYCSPFPDVFFLKVQDIKANFPTTGAMSVTLLGRDWSTVDVSTPAGMGGTACEVSRWQSDSMLQCKMPETRIPKCTISLTVAKRTVSLTRMVSTDDYLYANNAPVINTATTGGFSVTLVTVNLGNRDRTVATTLHGSTSASTSWKSGTSISCRTAASLGLTMPFSIAVTTVKRNTKTMTRGLTFDSPFVSDSLARNYAATGSQYVTMMGYGFSTQDPTFSVRLGNSSCAATTWTSDSSLACRIITGTGAIGGKPIAPVISVANQRWTSTSSFMYNLPPAVYLTVNADMQTFEPTKFITGLADFLKVDPSLIEILEIRQGSIIVIVRIRTPDWKKKTDDMAVDLSDKQNSILGRTLGITDIVIHETETEVFRPADQLINPNLASAVVTATTVAVASSVTTSTGSSVASSVGSGGAGGGAGAFQLINQVQFIAITAQLGDNNTIPKEYEDFGSSFDWANFHITPPWRTANTTVDTAVDNGNSTTGNGTAGNSTLTGNGSGSGSNGSNSTARTREIPWHHWITGWRIEPRAKFNKRLKMNGRMDRMNGYNGGSRYYYNRRLLSTDNSTLTDTNSTSSTNGTDSSSSSSDVVVEATCVGLEGLYDLFFGTLFACGMSMIAVFIVRSIISKLVQLLMLFLQGQKLRSWYMHGKHKKEKPPEVQEYHTPGLLKFPRWELTVALSQYLGLCESAGTAIGSACNAFVIGGVLVLLLIPGLFLTWGWYIVYKRLQKLNYGHFARSKIPPMKKLWKELSEVETEHKGLFGLIVRTLKRFKALFEVFKAVRFTGEWEDKSKGGYFSAKIEPFIGDYQDARRGYYYFIYDLIRKFITGVIVGVGTPKVTAFVVLTLFIMDFIILGVLRPFRDRTKMMIEFSTSLVRMIVLVSVMLGLLEILTRTVNGVIMFFANIAATAMQMILSVTQSFGWLFTGFGFIAQGAQAAVGFVKMVFAGWASGPSVGVNVAALSGGAEFGIDKDSMEDIGDALGGEDLDDAAGEFENANLDDGDLNNGGDDGMDEAAGIIRGTEFVDAAVIASSLMGNTKMSSHPSLSSSARAGPELKVKTPATSKATLVTNSKIDEEEEAMHKFEQDVEDLLETDFGKTPRFDTEASTKRPTTNTTTSSDPSITISTAPAPWNPATMDGMNLSQEEAELMSQVADLIKTEEEARKGPLFVTAKDDNKSAASLLPPPPQQPKQAAVPGLIELEEDEYQLEL